MKCKNTCNIWKSAKFWKIIKYHDQEGSKVIAKLNHIETFPGGLTSFIQQYYTYEAQISRHIFESLIWQLICLSVCSLLYVCEQVSALSRLHFPFTVLCVTYIFMAMSRVFQAFVISSVGIREVTDGKHMLIISPQSWILYGINDVSK